MSIKERITNWILGSGEYRSAKGLIDAQYDIMKDQRDYIDDLKAIINTQDKLINNMSDTNNELFTRYTDLIHASEDLESRFTKLKDASEKLIKSSDETAERCIKLAESYNEAIHSIEELNPMLQSAKELFTGEMRDFTREEAKSYQDSLKKIIQTDRS